MNKKPVYSVVIPVYNEERNIPELFNRLIPIMDNLNSSYEIIIIDDGSSDRSTEIIESFHKQNKDIKLISLSRNFGHQIAITAGLDYADGDAVIVMDADLQDDPTAIPEFIKKWKDGWDVVYAIRKKRKELFYKKFAFYIFYRILNNISNMPIPIDAGVFSLIDRKVVDTLKKMRERNRFTPGLRAWSGFRQTGIEVERNPRLFYKPRVSFLKLLNLALNGFFSFSLIPLKTITFIGLIISCISFLLGLFLIYLKIFTSLPIIGWTSTMVSILFLGGVQLVALGIIGEYIGRIYEEVKQRPIYITKRLVGFE